ncbi:hypothetical protein F5Y18DRAFT_375004 [Xylariaceae sp. FL1019]|nr:hypothetical protein F5Y18DRAFT_375004 [Xylariaceae sp. FL1019]
METREPSRPQSQNDFSAADMVSLVWQSIDTKLLDKRLIIAVDFGTTFSSVFYVALDGQTPEYLELDRIKGIDNYSSDKNCLAPDDPMRRQVPTELIYPSNRKFRNEDLAQLMSHEGQEDDGDDTVTEHDTDPEEQSSAESNTLQWGYTVHEKLRLPFTHKDPKNKPLSRFKLLLDENPKTKRVREDLENTLDSLRRRRIISDKLQVIADYLTYLLHHCRSQLRERGFDASWGTEMVMCVPAIWTQKACRAMQTAMAIGMEKTGFQGANVKNNSIENLFIVSEPEAAAAYALAQDPSIKPGDTFVLLDAGGGTIDANTYTISLTMPLRLQTEVVEPDGGLFGSSYLNEEMRKLLMDMLKDERYLETGIETIEGIVEPIVCGYFEYEYKRTFDCYRTTGVVQFPVSGLRDDPAKPFIKEGSLRVDARTIRKMFFDLLEPISSIMLRQIREALQKGCRVETVILIGGFGASISLQKYLRKKLREFSRDNDCDIVLRTPEKTATAVAQGAVLRAFNKDRGPERQARSSYGILRTEPFYRWGQENRPEYAGVKPWRDPDDGLYYIVNTIDWVLKKGSLVPTAWNCKPFACSHTFKAWPKPKELICKEVLYVSDRSTKSHYHRDSEENQGAEKIGQIVADFTFLLEDLKPVGPVVDEMTGKVVGRRHYRVDYWMVICVLGRDLRCFAIYDKTIIENCRINIAPAFKPGVK